MKSLLRSWLFRGALAVVVALVVGIGALVAYGYVQFRHLSSIERYTPGGTQVSVRARTVEGLGTVLVTDKGYALYMFPPDDRQRVTCTGECASAWPPLVVPAGASVVAGDGVKAGLLGTLARPGGGRVVTYHGWPLYTYVGDADPLKAAGQGVDADGGYWYVLRPSGEVVTSAPS